MKMLMVNRNLPKIVTKASLQRREFSALPQTISGNKLHPPAFLVSHLDRTSPSTDAAALFRGPHSTVVPQFSRIVSFKRQDYR